MSPELVSVCKQLIKDGKNVSVGMLKSRAPKNTPLPHIIQAVQFCKTQSAAVMDMPEPETISEPESDENTDSEKIAKMAAKISALEQRIAVLEAKIK